MTFKCLAPSPLDQYTIDLHKTGREMLKSLQQNKDKANGFIVFTIMSLMVVKRSSISKIMVDFCVPSEMKTGC